MSCVAGDERAKWTVRPAGPEDRGGWASSYLAYGVSAGQELSTAHLDRVWSWLLTPEVQTQCLLLHLAGVPQPVGLAHYRPFERPLHGSIGCYLDDLFVDQRVRGRGGARTLLTHLRALASVNGWSTVRWTTGQDNPARAMYDTLATRSPVITFDMDPSPAR